jgi:hypothetical protein
MPSVPWKEMALAAAVGVAAPEMVLAQQQPARAEPSTFTDAELQAYARAHAEIEPIQLAEFASTDAAARARDETQISAILARHGLTREDYDAIASVAMSDPGVSARIAQLAEADGAPQGA